MFETKFTSDYSTSYYQVPSPQHEKVFSQPLSRHTILTGAIRTGKTRCAIVRFFMELMLRYKHEKYQINACIIARSRASLKYNILDSIWSWLPPSIARHVPSSMHSNGFSFLKRISIRFFCCEDEASISRLMGSSLQLIFIDECAYFTESQYSKICSRLTKIQGSMFPCSVISTSNPDAYTHWLNQKYILPAQRGCLDQAYCTVHQFKLNYETCPFLTKDTIDGFIADYSKVPVLYKRFVNGEWCSSQGAIFGTLTYDKYMNNQLEPLCTHYWLGVDFGYTAANGVVLLGCVSPTAFQQCRILIADDAQFTTCEIESMSSDYRASIIENMIRGKDVRCIIYDSAQPELAASLSFCLRAKGIFIPLYPAEKNTKEGLEILLLALANQRLLFCEKARRTYHCFSELEYSERSEKDKVVIKQGSNDHLYDAVRYVCMHHEVKQILTRR